MLACQALKVGTYNSERNLALLTSALPAVIPASLLLPEWDDIIWERTSPRNRWQFPTGRCTVISQRWHARAVDQRRPRPVYSSKSSRNFRVTERCNFSQPKSICSSISQLVPRMTIMSFNTSPLQSGSSTLLQEYMQSSQRCRKRSISKAAITICSFSRTCATPTKENTIESLLQGFNLWQQP